MPNSYTYEELLLNDVFEFDDIEVKQVSKSNWTNIKSYYFPEEHEDSDKDTSEYYVDDQGQVHFKNDKNSKKQESEYTINEFGEMVRQGGRGGETKSKKSRTSTRTSSNSSSSSASSSGDNTGWKIFLTIAAIIIFIVITCSTGGWGSLPAGPIGAMVLKSIWSDDW